MSSLGRWLDRWRTRGVVLTALLGGTAALAAQPGEAPARHFKPPAHMSLSATAYCQGGTTQSGTRARTGIVAADPDILPVGSVVKIDVPAPYSGIYTVMDTGPTIKGRALDIFIPNCAMARRFGRQLAKLRVLRLGWDPKNSALPR
jgi:3D (Asp-Asp-Asp) domain-containing protein